MSTKQLTTPELHPITENNLKLRHTPEAIRKLLLPIKNLAFQSDSDNSSVFSELSDKYHDIQKDDCLLKLYKSEMGESALDGFTDDYKTTVKELREEMQVTQK